MTAPFLVESYDSRALKASLKNPSVLLKFTGVGYDTEELCRAAVFAATPRRYPDYPFLWRESITVARVGAKVYKIEVPYAVMEGKPVDGGGAGSQHEQPPNENDNLGPEFNFDGTTATETALKSITTIASRAVGDVAAPNFAKAINVTPDGVKGVERAAPKFEWSLTAHFPFLTHKYTDRLRVMAGKMNKRLFFNRWAGECLFVGAVGNWRQSDAWTVTYKFRDSPTWGDDAWKQKYAPGQPPGNAPQTPKRPFGDALLDLLKNGDQNKIVRGWDYLWVMTTEDTSNGRKVTTPFAAYVEQIYREVDFYWLGIGGAAVPPANDLVPPEDANW